MIWLTWRQFRWQAVTAAAVLVVLAAALAATGPGLVSRFDNAGLSTCHATCGTLAANFLTSLRGGPYTALFDAGVVIMYLAPALMGIFWGAPLIARELETGTHRLVWNQTRHPYALDGGQAWAHRTGCHGHRGPAQPDDRLVGEPDRSCDELRSARLGYGIPPP